MATPRKRYYRQPDSLLREPWPRDVKLVSVLLQCHMNTRRARDGIPDAESGRVVLSPADLKAITGKSWLSSGRKLLETWSKLVTVSLKFDREFTEVDWPKWPEYQTYHARNSARVEPPPAPVSDSVKNKGKATLGETKKRRSPKPPTADGYAAADMLGAKLTERHPGTSVRRTAWAREADKIDAPHVEILATIEWLFSTRNTNAEYPFVVASGKALRDKWPNIRERMGKGKKPRSQATPAAPSFEQPEGPAATPAEIRANHKAELAGLDHLVASGTKLTPYQVNRLRSLRKMLGEKPEGEST